MNSIKLFAFAFSGMLALSGCGDDNDHTEDSGHGEYSDDCQAIVDACHDVDPGVPGEIYTCHIENAHENNEEYCTAEKERCVGLCEALAADAGDHDDGGSEHAE